MTDLVLGVPVKCMFASSREQLASELGVSVRCIASHLASGKSPGRRQNGSYDVQAWSDYINSAGTPELSLEGDDVGALKRRKLIASVEFEEARAKNERLAALARDGTLVEIEKVRQLGRDAVGRLHDALLRELLPCSCDAKQYDALKSAVDRAFSLTRKEIESIS